MRDTFHSATPESYESRTRSVRLHGVVTSLRLENLYWDVLAEIGDNDGITVAQLLERLHDEFVASRREVGDPGSNESCLRLRVASGGAKLPSFRRRGVAASATGW